MKKFVVAALVLFCGVAMAQTTQAKKDLIARVLTIQQSAIEQAGVSLVQRPAMQMLGQAGQFLQTSVAPEKREAVAKQVQADAKKYVDDVGPYARNEAVKLGPTTIGTLLDERFTEDELKQLVAILESPVNKKYLQMGGDFEKALLEALVTKTKPTIEPKLKSLQLGIGKTLDGAAGLAAPASASTPAKPNKPAKAVTQ